MNWFFATYALFAIAAIAEEKRYEVAQVTLVYDTPHPDQIPIYDLLELPIHLSWTPSGFQAPLKGESATIFLSDFSSEERPFSHFYESALEAICHTLSTYLKKQGYEALVVIEKKRSRHEIVFHIDLTTVAEIGAVALNENTSEKQLQYIVSHSPLQPAEKNGAGNLLSKPKLEDYLSFLNRHPKRKVDARLYPLSENHKVGIDFLTEEQRPWSVYVEVCNIGNHVTGLWQETVGFLDTQLSAVDDIFHFEATTNSFHSYFTVLGSYDRPILSWPQARWKLYGMFNRFAAADLGFQDKIFVGTQAIVDLSFRQTAAQKRDFFFDIVEALRYFNIHVTNKIESDIKGKSQFAAPVLALCFNQIQSPLWRFSLKLEALFSPPGLFASSRNQIDLLGRIDTSKGWTILSGNFLTGFYLGTSKPVNEFVFSLQGQYAFHYRLIPQLKYIVGGFNTVRGYTEAINSGDSALVGKAEYIFHLPPLFTPNPKKKTKLFGKDFHPVPRYLGARADWDLLFRLFVDGARSIDNQKIPSLEENSTLLSTGLGLELDLWQNFMVRMDWGITLNKAVNQDAGHSIVYLNSTMAY